MKLTQEDLARRLRQARESSGFTQESVAEALSLSRSAVTQLETGKRSVSTLELAELSKLYMRPVASFLDDAADEPAVAMLRVLDSFAEHPEVRVNVSAALEVCRDAVSLRALLGLGSVSAAPPVYELPPPANSAEAVSQGEHVATEERRRLSLGNTPIADMSDLINGEGVWATGTKLPDEMSGLFLCDPSVGLVVLVNLLHPVTRKRFSYAHEYAHVLIDRRAGSSVSTKANNPEMAEKRANAFAAAFLMPRSGVTEELARLGKGRGSRETSAVYDVNTEGGFDAEARSKPGSQAITFQDVAMLAHHFGVSYQAMTYRLSSLDFVNKPQREVLFEKAPSAASYLSSLCNAPAEAPSQDRELHMEVARLAFEAYRVEEISRGRLMEVCSRLGISAVEVERQTQALR